MLLANHPGDTPLTAHQGFLATLGEGGVNNPERLAIRLAEIAREAARDLPANPTIIGSGDGVRKDFDGPAFVRRAMEVLRDAERSLESKRDVLATRLMEVFRDTRSRAAFGLLYELCGHHLLQQVIGRLRRYPTRADAHDVLQEVFFNIYRYPHRFNGDREDAFRVWTSTIVRNTVLKHLRSLSRSGRAEVPFDDLPEPSGTETDEPLRDAIASESQTECSRVYLTYLHLYLRFYRMLSPREQKAIHLVEVQGFSYREAAGELGIKLENLKMVIFRARRKIHRSMRRVFEGLPPDLRPARDPEARSENERNQKGHVAASAKDEQL